MPRISSVTAGFTAPGVVGTNPPSIAAKNAAGTMRLSTLREETQLLPFAWSVHVTEI